MDRRSFIRNTSACLGAATFARSINAFAAAGDVPRLTPAAEIEEKVRAARPSRGGRIPADFAKRFGATHYGGRYHFTDKPYIIEGAEKMHELGMSVAKFWLREDDLLGKTEAGVVELWDRAMAVCFALDVPWIVHWELFCNEPNDGTKPDRRVR